MSSTAITVDTMRMQIPTSASSSSVTWFPLCNDRTLGVVPLACLIRRDGIDVDLAAWPVVMRVVLGTLDAWLVATHVTSPCRFV